MVGYRWKILNKMVKRGLLEVMHLYTLYKIMLLFVDIREEFYGCNKQKEQNRVLVTTGQNAATM